MSSSPDNGTKFRVNSQSSRGTRQVIASFGKQERIFDPAATFTERLLGQVAMHSAHISGLCGGSEEHGGATRRGNSGIQEQSANQTHADLSDCKSIGTFV